MRENFFDARETMLYNGLKIVTVKRNTQLMSLNVGINVGSIYEDESQKGIAHFIEHMMFKGTYSKNNEEINDILEGLGGDYNAYTDYTRTVYSITALSNELEPAVSIIADMLINSNLPQSELNKERGVILSEIKTSIDDIEDLSYRKINEIAFDRNPIKYEILGYEYSVNNIERKHLVEFYSKYYVPNNCCISVVSPFEHEYVIDIIKKYFNLWEYNEILKKYVIIENNKPIIKKTFKKDIEQGTITYLYTFYGLTEKEELALRILNNKFGDSSNSILFKELREKRGLVYDVYSTLDVSKNIKTFNIFTSMDSKNIDSVLNIIDLCIDKIINKEIIFDSNTMKQIKKVFKTSIASTLEDSSELSSYVLLQMMEDDDIFKFEHEMEYIDNMKGEDLYCVANKVFKNPTIYIIMPEKSE